MAKISIACFTLIFCTGIMSYQILVPKGTAYKSREFLLEDQRSRQQNNIMQKSQEMENYYDGIGGFYSVDSLENDPLSKDMPALEYANMLRNDIILLDNSVETRTKKRGNTMFENHRQYLLDTACSCQSQDKKTIHLGDDWFPQVVESRNCIQKMCGELQMCESINYNVTVFQKSAKDRSPIQLRQSKEWRPAKIEVTVACLCKADYMQDQKNGI